VKVILEHRDAHKRKKTYFENFLFFADSQNVLHGNLNQAGTATGRFSANDPNMQNLTKEDEDEAPSEAEMAFPVRRAFIPRPGFCFFMPDFKQMEYRLLLDYANEKEIIRQVMAGVDVHQATANLVGISRKEAKTFNFAFVYGAGVAKLAAQLKRTLEETKRLKYRISDTLPQTSKLIRNVMDSTAQRGFLTNWFGRRYIFPDPKFSYKGPNYLIQGGCADIVKIGMNRCDDFLKNYKSQMVLNVHDEVVFEMHESELHLCEELCRILSSAYPYKFLPMEVDASHSWKSLHDKVKGFPILDEKVQKPL